MFQQKTVLLWSNVWTWLIIETVGFSSQQWDFTDVLSINQGVDILYIFNNILYYILLYDIILCYIVLYCVIVYCITNIIFECTIDYIYIYINIYIYKVIFIALDILRYTLYIIHYILCYI